MGPGGVVFFSLPGLAANQNAPVLFNGNFILPEGEPFVIFKLGINFGNPKGNQAFMEEKEFQEEMDRIREDIEDFPRPLSSCEYFHGREKRFQAGQLKLAVEFFLKRQQERFERGEDHGP